MKLPDDCEEDVVSRVGDRDDEPLDEESKVVTGLVDSSYVDEVEYCSVNDDDELAASDEGLLEESSELSELVGTSYVEEDAGACSVDVEIGLVASDDEPIVLNSL